jgi:hypothetical protein
LASLSGAPKKVGGFDCSWNKITELEGSPAEVGGRFDCSSNRLTTLKGAPAEVGGDFSCSFSKLTSLAGAPQRVGGDFLCADTPLTSLEGAPQSIAGGIRLGGPYDKPLIKTTSKDWNLQGWMRIYKGESEKAKDLIATLPAFKAALEGNPDEMEDLGDLTSLGF